MRPKTYPPKYRDDSSSRKKDAGKKKMRNLRRESEKV
jgi:hypothetical protein